jgi:membrane dipeptidase
VPPFVSAEVIAWSAALGGERQRLGLASAADGWPRAPRPGETAQQAAAANPPAAERATEEGVGPWLAANPRPKATIAQVADHVEHAREVAGIDHVGLGGDYDGTDALPEGLEDVSRYPRLLEELAGRGWSEPELQQLTGRNVLRVLRESERLAAEPLWPLSPAR